MSYLGGFFLYLFLCLFGSILTCLAVGLLWSPAGPVWALIAGLAVFSGTVALTIWILNKYW